MGGRKPGLQRLALLPTSYVSSGTLLSPQAWQRESQSHCDDLRGSRTWQTPEHSACLVAGSACIWILVAQFTGHIMHFCVLWVRGGKGMEERKKRDFVQKDWPLLCQGNEYSTKEHQEGRNWLTLSKPHLLPCCHRAGEWKANGSSTLLQGGTRRGFLANMSHHNYRRFFSV